MFARVGVEFVVSSICVRVAASGVCIFQVVLVN